MSEDSKALLIEGFLIDKIKITYESISSQPNPTVLAQYHDIMHGASSIMCPPNQSTLEVYWRTIHLDQWCGQRINDDIKSVMKSGLATIEEAERLAQSDDLFDLRYCKGRCFFLTPLGHLGFGPVDSQVGDLVVIFPGGKVPYILRRSGDNYLLIGEW